MHCGPLGCRTGCSAVRCVQSRALHPLPSSLRFWPKQAGRVRGLRGVRPMLRTCVHFSMQDGRSTGSCASIRAGVGLRAWVHVSVSSKSLSRRCRRAYRRARRDGLQQRCRAATASSWFSETNLVHPCRPTSGSASNVPTGTSMRVICNRTPCTSFLVVDASSSRIVSKSLSR